MNNGYDRLPPNDKDSERALISTMLKDSMLISEAMALVKPDQFYTVAHQHIFAAITELADKRGASAADVVTVAQKLIEAGVLEDCGGAPYLADLYDSAPAARNYALYAENVRSTWMRRKAIHTCHEAIARSFDMTIPAAEVIDTAEREILGIQDEVNNASESCTLAEALNQTFTRIDARVERYKNNEQIGVLTGLYDVDQLLAGFQQGEMVIIAARPSQGKSSLGLQCAAHAAVSSGIPTLFISLEQSRTELVERLLCAYARIDSYRMRRGYLSAEEISRISETSHQIGQAPLYFDDGPVQGMRRISSSCRRMKNRHNIGIVFIDYLQIIDVENTRASRQEQVAGISKRIKALARELKIPVVAMAQLNRQADDGKNSRPRLGHLKESGAIEQDADTVVMIHREHPEEAHHPVDIIVAKQRNGPTGDCQVLFNRPFMKFENCASDVYDVPATAP